MQTTTKTPKPRDETRAANALTDFEKIATDGLARRLASGMDMKAAQADMRGWKLGWNTAMIRKYRLTAEENRAAWLRATAAAKGR